MKTKYDKIFNKTICLNNSELEEYLNNTLTNEKKHKVEKHLNDCKMCQEELDGLSYLKNKADLPLIVENINSKIDNRIKRNSNFFYLRIKRTISIAASFLLLVSLTFLINYYVGKQSDNKMADQIEQSSESKEVKSGNENESTNEDTKVSSEIIETADESEIITAKKRDVSDEFSVENETADNLSVADVKTAKNDNNSEFSKSERSFDGRAEEIEEIDDFAEDIDDIHIEKEKSGEPVVSVSEVSYNKTSEKENNAKYEISEIAADENDFLEGKRRAVFIKKIKLKDRESVSKIKSTAYSNFISKEYKAANSDYEKVLKKDSKDTEALFYSGISLYKIKQYNKALLRMNKVIKSNHKKYTDEAVWYKVLINEKLNRDKENIILLNNIIQNKGNYQEKARKKLNEVEK